MNDIQNLHLPGAKYWTLLSWQKWISSRDQKNKRRQAGNRTEEVRGAACGEERARGSVSTVLRSSWSWHPTECSECLRIYILGNSPRYKFSFSSTMTAKYKYCRTFFPSPFRSWHTEKMVLFHNATHTTPTTKPVNSWVPQKPAIHLISEDWYDS